MPAVSLTANYDFSGVLTEDVRDAVTVLDPTETPILANIGEVDIDNPESYEWMQDSLNPVDAGGVVDGVDFADVEEGVTVRVKRKARCQIQAKAIKLSNRAEESSKHGADSEIAYQLALRSDSLKRDCEAAITTFRTPVANSGGVAPLTAGIPTWLATNADYGATGAAPTVVGEEPVVGSSGTARALDQSAFLDLLGDAYTAGGNPDMVVLGVSPKQRFSEFMFSGDARSATQYQNQGASPSSGVQVVGAVDYYVSDFGVVAIVVDRFIAQATDMLILDTTLWKKGTFRNYQLLEMGVEGDHQRMLLLHDFALISLDEAGSAIYADIDPTLAMTA